MTLDKAIEVYEFWANAHERDAEYHRPLGYSHETTANVAEMQAREERQFAEWLKELKAYRETYPYGVEGYPPRTDTPQTEMDKCYKCKWWNYSYGCSNKKGICDFEQADTPQTERSE